MICISGYFYIFVDPIRINNSKIAVKKVVSHRQPML